MTEEDKTKQRQNRSIKMPHVGRERPKETFNSQTTKLTVVSRVYTVYTVISREKWEPHI